MFWNWFFTILVSFSWLNIVIFTGHILAPKAEKLFYKYILRKDPPPKKALDYSALEDFKLNEQKNWAIGFRYVILNVLLICAFITYPFVHGHLVRYIAMIVMTVVIYIMGMARTGIEYEIEEEYKMKNRDYGKKDYEQRNVMLAKTVLTLEREIQLLQQHPGQPKKNKTIRPSEDFNY